jgi:uncharacterized Zn-binding protein involved in type VI secretion
MIHRRYHIRDGAKTTAGGIVRASSQWLIVNGKALAREGDPVNCTACGTQGVIKCVMPRLTDRFEGKEYALSDDLCICKCSPPPKLIADQDYKCQILILASVESPEEAAMRKAEEAAARTASAKTAAAPAVSAKTADLRPLRFLDQETGKPHANRPYRLEMTGGKVVQGTTDANGCTRPLTPEERVALRSWQAGRQ